MIHIYAICYWILPYAQQTIDNLLETASEPVHITVVEGRSKNSPQFLVWAKDCLAKNKIQRFVAADINCKGAGTKWIFNNFPPDASEDFCIITDLDVLVPKEVDWIKLTREAMSKGSICGFKLSDKNYTYPNAGWNKNESSFGSWLMGINTKVLKQYPDDTLFEDVRLLQQARNYGKTVQIQQSLYHLGWDAWKDDPEYWKYKTSTWNKGHTWQTIENEKIQYTVYTKENL